MSTSELPYGAIKVFVALIGVAGAGSFMMWLGSGSSTSSTIRSWEIVRASQNEAVNRKNFIRAENLGKQAVRLAERLGSSNYRVAVSHDDLGQILVAEKKETEAHKHFDDAVKIFQTNIIRAKDGVTKRLLLVDLANSQRNLGLLELSQGKAEDAEDLYKEAIANLETGLKDPASGRVDYFVAHREVDLMCRLASMNVILGRLQEGQKWFRTAVKLADESFYPAYLIKQAKEEFSAVLKKDGNVQEADALFSHDHWVKFAQAAENARAEGNLEECAKNLRAAADAAKTSRSIMHLAVISLKKLAKLQLQQNDAAGCRETCMEALQVWQTLGGGANSEADYVYGLLFRLAPSKENAKEVQTSRLKLRRDLYGESDFHVAETETELAKLCLETGDGKNAAHYANQAFETYNRLRVKQRGIGMQEVTLAEIFEHSRDYSKAEAMYSRALAAQMKRNKKKPAMIGGIYQHLATIYKQQGKHAERERAEREAQRWLAL